MTLAHQSGREMKDGDSTSLQPVLTKHVNTAEPRARSKQTLPKQWPATHGLSMPLAYCINHGYCFRKMDCHLLSTKVEGTTMVLVLSHSFALGDFRPDRGFHPPSVIM